MEKNSKGVPGILVIIIGFLIGLFIGRGLDFDRDGEWDMFEE